MRRYTFKQIRDMFFELYPQYQSERRYRKPQNEYSTFGRMHGYKRTLPMDKQ